MAGSRKPGPVGYEADNRSGYDGSRLIARSGPTGATAVSLPPLGGPTKSADKGTRTSIKLGDQTFTIEGDDPKRDGECMTYDIKPYDASIFYPEQSQYPNRLPKRRARAPRASKYKVVFVNGQLGNPVKHKYQAIATAIVSGGPVTGVYNSSQSVLLDTAHSAILDKTTSSLFSDVLAAPFKFFGAEGAAQRVFQWRFRALSSPATASLFGLLSRPEYYNACIVAHSQGNIIAANALNGVAALYGKNAIQNMRVIAVASPVVFWTEAKHIVHEYTFSNDGVGWLNLNWAFPLEKYLQKLPQFMQPHAPDYQKATLAGTGLKETEPLPGDRYKSERVAGFTTGGSYFTHSFYAYIGELWDKLIHEFP